MLKDTSSGSVLVQFSFLKLRIDEYHSSILCLRALFSRSLNELCFDQQLRNFLGRGVLLFERTTDIYQTEEKHGRKFRHLLSKRSPVHSGLSLKDKWVMNLSSEELSALERKGVEKGLKFAIAPRKMPTAEIVAAVEESISQLNDDLYPGVLNLLPKTFKRMFSMCL